MADYVVTGTLSPDATGNYTQNGTYDGQPAYERDGDAAYWLFYWWATDKWHISNAKGQIINAWWRTPPIEGDYAPIGTHTGTATVAAAAAERTKTINIGPGLPNATTYKLSP